MCPCSMGPAAPCRVSPRPPRVVEDKMECHSHISPLAGTATLLPLLSPLSSVSSIPGPLGLPTEGVPCATGKKGQEEPGEQGSGLGCGVKSPSGSLSAQSVECACLASSPAFF